MSLLDQIRQVEFHLANLHNQAVSERQHVAAAKLECAMEEVRAACGCWNYAIRSAANARSRFEDGVCDAAENALKIANPRKTRVSFTFEGKPYVSRMTDFGIYVNDGETGAPVCYRSF